MALILHDLKSLHDKAYNHNQVTRERASDDMVFYWITHWDDNLLQDAQLAYRGQFDLLRKAGRDIMSDLITNPVQVDFEPVDETRDDSAETLDGLYRSEDNRNLSIEAYNNARTEAIVCGFGAWMQYTEYVSSRNGDKNQTIRRRPIFEANNNVYFDPNDKTLDKSESNYVSVLRAYSEDGYKQLVEDLTGEDFDESAHKAYVAESFKSPEISYVFPWLEGEGKKIYVTEFYHREKVKTKLLMMENPFGQKLTLREDQLEVEENTLLDDGYSIESEKTVEVWQVTKYIASGAEILNGDMVDGERVGEVVAGEYLPVIPTYGEHAIIEGEEHWEGVTRLAKDPQRLRNFQMSYLADICSQSPREKPIFVPQQIGKHQDMYSLSGSENNFPFVFQELVDVNGKELPLGPVGTLPAPNIPPALIASIQLSREAVADVADAGLPGNIADIDLSGKAVLALQAKIDKQSIVYQENFKHAKRHDGVVYASQASHVFDVPRTEKITLPDGTRKTVKVMETVVNEQGEIVVLNDLNNVEFEVFSKIGPSYSSQKDQTVEMLGETIATLPPGDPLVNILTLKRIELVDGVAFDDVRDYVRKQQLIMGVRKPETPEDEQILAEASQQQQEPSAEMVLAQAEDKKGQAQLTEAETRRMVAVAEAQNKQAKVEVDVFSKQTDRMGVQVDAQEAGANINMKNIESFGKQLDNRAKVSELMNPKNQTVDELFQSIMTG